MARHSEAVYLFTCPKCGAKPQEPCIEAKRPHHARFRRLYAQLLEKPVGPQESVILKTKSQL